MSFKFNLFFVFAIAFVLVVDAVTPAKKDETSGECKDIATNCKGLIANCGDKAFEAHLKKYCNKSCGYCPPGKDCVDLSKNCKTMKDDRFCDSKSNPINIQRMYCAKTCGL